MTIDKYVNDNNCNTEFPRSDTPNIDTVIEKHCNS